MSGSSLRETKQAKLLLLLAVTLVCAALVALLPRIPQPESYHHFADQRTFLGIPRFMDVISNAPFLVIGWLGIGYLRSRRGRMNFHRKGERWAWFAFFAGVTATTFGSAYYHLDPGNSRLVWDRLPIAISFMGFLAAMLEERAGVGLRALLPLVFLGAGSVIYWDWTERLGHGDLRPYLFVQFFPAIAAGLLLWLFPARYSRTRDLLAVFGLYALAKIAESLDRFIFSLGHLVSGHTLKHLFAAAAAYGMLRMLELRSPVRAEGAPDSFAAQEIGR